MRTTPENAHESQNAPTHFARGSSSNRLDPACIYLGRDGGLIFAAPFLGWKPAEPVMEVNDDFFAEGCPIESRDGLSPFLVTLHDDPRREPALVH